MEPVATPTASDGPVRSRSGDLGIAAARMQAVAHFKGNKRSLPSKTCVVCGREMTWRKSWAKNWDEVRYCSDACRRRKGDAPAS